MLSAKKAFILFQIIDDVLDYLTNMGGYTGFTEEELKGGVGSTGVDLNQKDMEAFGRQKPEDAATKQTTDVFVVLLIVTPILGLFAGIAIFGPKLLSQDTIEDTQRPSELDLVAAATTPIKSPPPSPPADEV